MELKSTLRVFHEADLEIEPAFATAEGQTIKYLAGNDKRPSDKILVARAAFEAGTSEDLHWHMVEELCYVISGRCVVTDIEGMTYDLGPGSVIYAPPGLEGAHRWDIKEQLELLCVLVGTPNKTISFIVDQSSKKSCVSLETYIRRGGAFKKSL